MDQRIYDELTVGILRVMPKQVVEIILYGSVARQMDDKDSDVDIALLIHGDLSNECEDKLSDFIVDMNLKYDKVFSVIDIEYDHFLKWLKILPFYMNIEKEGITLWKAA